MKRALLLLLFVLPVASVFQALSADAQYVGAKKCMMCHKSENRGDQWGKWSAGPHAKAFITLKSDASKTIAQQMGIADPSSHGKCLQCHVTAFGAPAAKLADGFSHDEGVGCEACHGPGSLYKSMRVMKNLAAGTQDPQAVAFIRGDAESCLGCHNEASPTYKPFDFDKAWAEIEHNIPQ
ncbi:cytochrome c family protein [candidate division KSB1 bacterium]|nr:cytochrome c family protein [candidate division KSB1 bacterium]